MFGISPTPSFFFYYACSFIVLIEMHSGAHTHIQYFQRKLVGYSFLIDPEADGNITVYRWIESFSIGFALVKDDVFFFLTFFPSSTGV